MTAPEDLARSAYCSPFVTRWASKEMLHNWSDIRKVRLWRSLWIALAEAEQELGLAITDEQIQELRKHRNDINFEAAKQKEKEIRHDVMAHLHAYGVQCPDARPIMHLGATSAYVTDNAELIMIRDALRLLIGPLWAACRALMEFAREYKDLPCLGYTHLQPAQLTTVGKRACLWLQDLVDDLQEIDLLANDIPFRGAKGTTGSQASFLSLFDGDKQKACELDKMVADSMGFSRTLPITGQTYPRKLDYTVLATLGGLALSCHKLAVDVRLLAGMKELEEPFEEKQVGSSAMAYKRNPMRCERMTGLCRFMLCNVQNAAFTGADQWLERSLDDSANRRLSLAEGFLAADSVVRLLQNITEGLVVYPQVIARRIRFELPFMVTEAILMEAVKAGGDRQDLHECIRRHSMEAARRITQEGAENDLIERIRSDKAFAAVADRLDRMVEPQNFVGRAPEQVEEFLNGYVEPLLQGFEDYRRDTAELNV